MEQKTILAVDDSEANLYLMKVTLEPHGYNILTAEDGSMALDLLQENEVDLVISDQEMPEMDGLELLKEVKKRYEDVPFIMLTAHGSIDKAVASMKEGADDYITRTQRPDSLINAVERTISFHRINRENRELKEFFDDRYGFQNIIAQSPQMREALELAASVADSPHTSVAIYGETGTGKELLAHAINQASGCLESRFVGINCAGIPAGLLESELFGHVKGAFTGADKERQGKLAMARDGTLLLDEIGDMPFELQAKILRVLQERTYERVGSDKTQKVRARIIATTNRNLRKMVKAGQFREDLFHRISSYPITLPPLRKRKEDIPLLVDFFLRKFRSELGKKIPGVSQDAMELLVDYVWPGNVRELKNCIERAVILVKNELIRPSHLTLRRRVERSGGDMLEDEDKIRIHLVFEKDNFSLDAAINDILKSILKKCSNNKKRAAEILKVNRKMFYRRM